MLHSCVFIFFNFQTFFYPQSFPCSNIAQIYLNSINDLPDLSTTCVYHVLGGVYQVYGANWYTPVCTCSIHLHHARMCTPPVHSLHHCQPSFYGWSIKANNFCSYNSSSSVNSPESTMVTCMLGVPLCDPTCSIFLMVDIPSFNTRPKTTCLPSNQLVSAVQMKN